MSFLIPENQGEPIAPTRAPAPTRWERFQAAREQTALQMDSWGRLDQEREALVREMTERLGPDDAPLRPMVPGLPGTNYRRAVDAQVARALERAAALRDAPDQIALEGIPTDEASFAAEIERRMRAYYAEQSEVLGMAPDGAWFPELMGALSAGVTDHTTLATLPVGAAPGMGIRAAIVAEGSAGIAAEALSQPSQFRAAEVLDIEDPNVLMNLALSGGLSAALGGAQAGAARFWNRQLEARAAALDGRIDDRSATEHEAEVQSAARRLAEDPPRSIADAADRSATTAARTGRTTGVEITFDLGPRRPNPPDAEVLSVLELAASDALGPGARVEVYSGKGNYGASNRHPTGRAADLRVYRPDGSQVTLDDPEALAFAVAAAQRGAKGIGAGRGYMGDSFHIDVVPHADHGPGQGPIWGEWAKAHQDQLLAAMRGNDAPASGDGRMGRIVDAIIGVESGNRATAQNPNSSAGGLGQIIDATWLDLIKRHRPDLTEGRNDRYLLGLKFDADLNREMTLRYAEDNAARLKAAGFPDSPGNIYLAHFLGPEAALRALSTSPAEAIGSIMSRRAIRANRGVRLGNKPIAQFTVGDLLAWTRYKTRGAFGPEDVRDPPVFQTSRGFTQQGQVIAGERRIDVEYEVVDASILRPASGDLQPRDRSRASSDEQVAEIAARLDPVRLMPSPEADRGAPVVGPDNIIESGNGRVMALNRAAERHPERFEAYVSALRGAGFEVPAGVSRPVLIARRTSELDADGRRGFVVDANTSTIARMSATERARADARGIDMDTLAMFDPSQPLTAQANRAFVGRALASMAQTERAALADAKGVLNADGVRRLQQMVFARAYDAPDIVARMAETDAGDLRSLVQALDAAAPEWAAMRLAVAEGRIRPEFDITTQMLDAVRLIAEARALASRTDLGLAGALDELLNEVDLLKGAVDPLTAALVGKFRVGGKVAPADQVGSFLTRYAAEARKVGGVDEGLFGDGPSLVEVLRRLDADAFADLPDGYRPPSDLPARPAQPLPALSADLAEGASAPMIVDADQLAADSLRADLDAARADASDIALSLGEGQEARPVRELLNEIEEDEDLADVLALCGMGGRGA